MEMDNKFSSFILIFKYYNISKNNNILANIKISKKLKLLVITKC
jgi:hypothetical protein